MKLFPFLFCAILVSCQGLAKNPAPASSGGTFFTRLHMNENTLLPDDSLAMPISFTYRESKDYLGDSALVQIGYLKDTFLFSYASYFDGLSGAVSMMPFGEFKLYRIGPSSYELFCKIVQGFSDNLKNGPPMRYSSNVIAKPDRPFPQGRYRIVVLKVIPARFPVTAYESKAGGQEKILYQEPEYRISESWAGDLDVGSVPGRFTRP